MVPRAGVLLWEMHHGCRAWAGMTQSQIIHAVAICKQRLTFKRELSDSQAIVAYFHLADTCLVSPVPCLPYLPWIPKVFPVPHGCAG